jgi:hypothetical protein
MRPRKLEPISYLKAEQAKSAKMERRLDLQWPRKIRRAVTIGNIVAVGLLLLLGTCTIGLLQSPTEVSPNSKLESQKTYGWYGDKRITRDEARHAIDFLQRSGGLDRNEAGRAFDSAIEKR